MKNIKLLVVVLTAFSWLTAEANHCVNSDQSNAGEEVAKWANLVSKTASNISKLLEEAPEAEVALEVVELAADTVEAIAEAFEEWPMGSPKPIKIPWDSLMKTPKSWQGYDGDTIFMTRKRGSGKFVFQQTFLTSWKGIVAFDKKDTNKWAEVFCLSGDDNSMTSTINTAIGKTHYISLSKAKAFGVHTNMYLIGNWADAPEGYDYFFNWVKD